MFGSPWQLCEIPLNWLLLLRHYSKRSTESSDIHITSHCSDVSTSWWICASAHLSVGGSGLCAAHCEHLGAFFIRAVVSSPDAAQRSCEIQDSIFMSAPTESLADLFYYYAVRAPHVSPVCTGIPPWWNCWELWSPPLRIGSSSLTSQPQPACFQNYSEPYTNVTRTIKKILYRLFLFLKNLSLTVN